MSAITGLIQLDGHHVEPSVVHAMIDSMPHRGPDGRRIWHEAHVGLANGMLHTTRESLHEVLPLTNSAGTITLTADARIDNREELARKLGTPAIGEETSDSELILWAYEKWGTACVDHLVGDFTFVLWDERSQKLFGARDQFGVRPFYYYFREGERFVFGTEIKAILSAPGVPKAINEVRVADYLACNEEDTDSTLYQDIWILPGSHAFEVEGGQLRIWKYYTLAPATGLDGLSVEEYEARFREVFVEAVRSRLRSAFPVGSQLSGGLDSSAVTCVARDLLAEEGRPLLHTLSLVFDEVSGCDERPFINAVLEEGAPVVPHFIPGDAHGPLSNLEELYSVLDDRLVGGNQRTVWAMLVKAKEQGLRVVLDGYDGDTTIGHGYRHLYTLAERGDWDVFAREVRLLVERFGGTDQAQPFEKTVASITAAFNTYGVPAIKDQAERGQWVRFAKSVAAAHRLFGVRRRDLLRRYWKKLLVPYALLKQRTDSQRGRRYFDEGEQLVDPELAQRIGLADRLEYYRLRSAAYVNDGLVGERESQHGILSSPRRQDALSIMNHVGSMFGMEVRHPFMDRRLIELCLALPPEMSLRDGWTRYVLRSALRGILPDVIRERTGKADMTENFSRGLLDRDAEALRQYVQNLGVLARYVDEDRVSHLYEKASSAQAGDYSIERTFLTRTATLSILVNKRFGTEHTSAEQTASEQPSAEQALGV